MTTWFKTLLLAIAGFLTSVIPKTTYTEGVVGQPANLLPPFVQTEADKQISSLLFRGLTRYNDQGEVVPDLAESWEISADNKTYTFTLKEDIYWHDGTPITSTDIIYTTSVSPALRDIAIDKLNEKQVKFYLQDPFTPFLQILSIGIIPAHLPKQNPVMPIGSGDYKVVSITKDVLISKLILETSNKDYYFKRLKFRFYLSDDDLETAAKMGEIDGYGGWLISGWENFNTFSAPLSGRYYGVFFNVSSGPEILKNKDFRNHLAARVPREILVEQALGNQALPVSSPLAGSWAFDPEAEYIKYDSSLVKDYKQKLTIIVPDRPEHIAMASLLKDEWKHLGVDLVIRPEPTATLQEKIIKPRLFEMALLAQESSTPDPDRYALWHSTQIKGDGLNITGFEAVRVDKALELGRKISDKKDRFEHYQNFQRILADEVPVIYLYQPIYAYHVKNNIDGVDLGKLFFAKDHWKSLISWKRV